MFNPIKIKGKRPNAENVEAHDTLDDTGTTATTIADNEQSPTSEKRKPKSNRIPRPANPE